MKRTKNKLLLYVISLCVIMNCFLSGCTNSSDGERSIPEVTSESVTDKPTEVSTEAKTEAVTEVTTEATTESAIEKNETVTLEDIPPYSDKAYIELNGNKPSFTDEDKKRTDAFEEYSPLDSKGRCGVAYANICKELMPTEERGEIGDMRDR